MPEQFPIAPEAAPAAVSSDVLDKAVEETIRRQTLSWRAEETGEELCLSVSHVRKLFAHPTKKGRPPTDRDCWLFLQLCKARGLNPYVGDAYLVGFDNEDGTASFSLIIAHQALLKRAEATGKKVGMQSGVIVVVVETGEEKERVGDFFLEDREKLVGGWAKVFRSDWEYPAYERVRLTTYNKGQSRWKIDPAGMIVKVAEASAHRLAFPRETGGLRVREEAVEASPLPEDERQELPQRPEDQSQEPPPDAPDAADRELSRQSRLDEYRSLYQNSEHLETLENARRLAVEDALISDEDRRKVLTALDRKIKRIAGDAQKHQRTMVPEPTREATGEGM